MHLPKTFYIFFWLMFFFIECVKRLSHFYLPFHVLSVSFLCHDWGFPTSPGQFVLWTRKSELGKMTLAVNEKNLLKYQKDNRCRIYWKLRISYIKNQWQKPTVQLREPSQCSVVTQMGRKSKKERGCVYIYFIYIYISDSLCCTVETNTTLLSNSNKIKHTHKIKLSEWFL